MPQKKILIVEDEDTLLVPLSGAFKQEQFEVRTARDGEEGLSRALEEKPDIILLDIRMPKMNGLVMMQKVRESGDWGKKVPIILLTNLSPDDESVINDVVLYEPAYYLVKVDFLPADVVNKVKEILGNS